jgi:hypothetical protein
MNEMERLAVRTSALIRYELSVIVMTAMLGGCNGSSSAVPQSGATDVARTLALTNPAHFVPAQRVGGRKSWISPLLRNALQNTHKKKRKLIWVSDVEYGALEAYDYKTGAEIGEVTGFSYPYGLCSDASGNVYFADFSLEEGFEIQARTFEIIKTWPTGGEAIGCSVSRNGDVAFTNFYPGGVVVFPGGGSSGTFYPGPGYDWPATYDPNGNLFVTCNYAAPCSSPRIAELPAGGSQWMFLNFSTGITFPGAVQWDGKYLAFADQSCSGTNNSCVDQVTVSGSSATLVNQVQLTAGGSSCSGYVDIGGSWGFNAKDPNGLLKREANALASPNLWCSGSVDIWPYPAGGAPERVLPLMPNSYAYGATITKI